MIPEVGQPAPDFSLPHRPGEGPIRLSDFRGRDNVVLLFFPLAWTSTCTRELCSIRDDYDLYRDLGATVLGISVDSPFALQRWSREENFPFPLLSDFNRRAAKSYGALYDELMGLEGIAKRATFVIDREGRIRYAEVLEDAGRLPDLEAVRTVLGGLND